MATGNNGRDVRMTLSVETLGEENIKKLQTSVASLAKEGGAAAPEFQRLADEIARMGEQSGTLAAFSALSDQTAEFAQRQQQASAAAAELRANLEVLATSTQEAADRQRAAATALDAGQQAARASRDELARLIATTDTAGKAEASYAAKVTELRLAKIQQRAEVERLREALKTANSEVGAAEAAEAKLAAAYANAARAADSAAKALQKHSSELQQSEQNAQALGLSTENVAASQAELIQGLNRSGKAAGELAADIDRLAARERELEGIRAFEVQYEAAQRMAQSAEYAKLFDQALEQLAASERAIEAQNNEAKWQREAFAIVETAHAAQKLARETEVLAAAERELAAQAAFEKQAEDARHLLQAAEYVRLWERQLAEAEAQARQTADAARAASDKIGNAFRTVGVRSAAELRDEILQIREAMQTIGESAGSAGEDIDSAFGAGSERIAEIELELRRMNGTLTLSDHLALLFANSIGQIAAGNLIADAMGYLVNKVKELGVAFVATIVQTEQFRRGLMAVYKDTALAAKQFLFLRTTANAAGLSVGELSANFVKFSAATRAAGIPLEVTNRLFAEVSRAAGALGLSGEQVSGMLEALQQMASKGTVSMEELRQQLGDRLPGALSLVAKGLGLTEAELVKLVEGGGLAARDLFPALTKALGEMQGEVSGLLPSWGRLKNAMTEAAQSAGDSGWTGLLTLGLQALATVLGAIVLPLSALSEGLLFVGKAAVAMYGMIRGDKDALKWLAEEAGKATDRLASLDKAFARAAGFTIPEATDALEAHNKTLVAAGTAAAQASAAITSTAKAQEAQAYAAKLAADGTLDHSSRIVQLKAYIDGLLGSQAKEIDASGKLAAAARIEGESLVKLTELQGKQALTLGAQVTAAEKNVAAMDTLATAHRTETELLTLKRDEIIKAAIAQDGNTKSRQLEIDAIEQKIKVSDSETEKSKASADAMRNEMEMRRLNVEAYKDNSARVAEYQKAVDAAQRTLEAMVVAEEAGRASAEDLAKAQGNVAKATFLLNDALEDSIDALDREARMKQASANLTIAKMNAELDNIKAMAESARASGNYHLAAVLEIDARRKQIDIIKLSILAKEEDAKATIRSLEVERAALDLKDPMLKAKQAEIDIRLANAKAKLVEAGAGKDVIAALEREIQAIRDNGVERQKNTRGQDDNTGSRHRNADAIDRQTSALGRQKEAQQSLDSYIKHGKSGENYTDPKTGTTYYKNASGQMGSDGLRPGYNNSAVQMLRNKAEGQNTGGAAYTESDLATAIADAQAQSFNNQVAQASSSGVYDLFGRQAAAAEARRAQNLVDTIRTSLKGNGYAGASGFAAPTAQPAGASKTVNITVNGRNTPVQVASDADATALTNVLRQLESAAGASS